jgi:elongation factor Ts
MNFPLELLKKLREETLAGVSDCRQALEDANGDYAKAVQLLKERGIEKAAKKSDRLTTIGVMEGYVHAGKVGVLVELFAETDFVVKNDEFKKLSHEIALQIAAMAPKTLEELLSSPYIRDSKLTIDALVKLTIAKMGENITIGKFTRMSLGE